MNKMKINKSHVLSNCQRVLSSMMRLYMQASFQKKNKITYYTCGNQITNPAPFTVHDGSVMKRALVESTHCLIY